jgi:hypothetical protein
MNNIKDIIKGKSATFDCFKDKRFFYTIECDDFTLGFQIPIDDIPIGMMLFTKHRAISLVKYINKSIEDNTLVKML